MQEADFKVFIIVFFKGNHFLSLSQIHKLVLIIKKYKHSLQNIVSDSLRLNYFDFVLV